MKKEGKIKPVKGFNQAEGEGFGNMGKGNDTFIDQIEGTSIGPGSDHDIETTAKPGTEGSYSSDIGIVIGTTAADPLDALNRKIERGLIENSSDLFELALDTMKAKNQDYAGSDKAEHAMRNFIVSADVAKIPMSKGILVRLMDKMTRIGNLVDSGKAAVKTESVLDTLQDAINYCAILHFGLLIEQRDRLVKQNEELSDL